MTAPKPPQIPKRFSAYIGGYMGSSYRVELSEGTLICTDFEMGARVVESVTITPTAAQWRSFRKRLDNLDVWGWRSSYKNEYTILDGTQWSLVIAYEDRALETGGDNAYPRATDELGFDSGVFARYRLAVRTLTGRKGFG